MNKKYLMKKFDFWPNKKVEIRRMNGNSTWVKIFKANSVRYLEYFWLCKNCLLPLGKWGKSRKTL